MNHEREWVGLTLTGLWKVGGLFFHDLKVVAIANNYLKTFSNICDDINHGGIETKKGTH